MTYLKVRSDFLGEASSSSRPAKRTQTGKRSRRSAPVGSPGDTTPRIIQTKTSRPAERGEQNLQTADESVTKDTLQQRPKPGERKRRSVGASEKHPHRGGEREKDDEGWMKVGRREESFSLLPQLLISSSVCFR